MTEPIDLPGPDHRAEPTGAPEPSKAFWRTALQVGPAALISLVLILPAIIQDTVAQFGAHLPDGFRLWLLGFASVLTLLASWAARIMARPDVIEWFKKYAPFFAPQKKD